MIEILPVEVIAQSNIFVWKKQHIYYYHYSYNESWTPLNVLNLLRRSNRHHQIAANNDSQIGDPTVNKTPNLSRIILEKTKWVSDMNCSYDLDNITNSKYYITQRLNGVKFAEL